MDIASTAEFARAVNGLREFFLVRQTCAGVVARRLLGTHHEEDDRLTDQLIRERRRRTSLDGGVGGWAVATTWAAWELIQLGCSPDHTGVSRMIGYLVSRQNQPGRFGEGCSERRHAIGHCQHFIRGFFSPGSKDEVVAPLALPSGVVVANEWEARFAASCFSLRVALLAGQERRKPVREHVESLLHLGERWTREEFAVSKDLALFATSAVALAPLGYRDRFETLHQLILSQQESDGSWPDTNLFHAVETLVNIPTKTALQAVSRSTPLILARQQTSGAFDETNNEEIALIALRALRTHGLRHITPRSPRAWQSTVKR